MTDIRHIVFDVGKVLVHYDPHLAYVDLIPDISEREAFLSDVCSAAWNREQDRGRSWKEAEAEAIARHPDKAALIRAFRQRWHLMVSHAHDEVVAILKALIESGRDVTLLTNFAADTYREATRRFPFLTEGRGTTVSGHVGLLKPDAAIYRLHTANFDLAPTATLFFDDTPQNVEGAREAGWNAERFLDAGRMRGDLERYGIDL